MVASDGLYLSVLICTHNRSGYLAEAIQSVQRQTLPADRYEIIVVDNASTDDTLRIVEQVSLRSLVAVKYLYEPRLGLSTARNTGIEHAKGAAICIMDDDAVATPDWLAGFARVFDRDKEIACAGGGIELLWDAPRPHWYPQRFEGILGASRRLGDVQRELTANEYPLGGNLAVRRKALDKLSSSGWFDPNFGHTGLRLGAHEETWFCDQIRDHGPIFFIPDALVKHHVPPERATRSYVLNRSFILGLSDAQLAQRRKPASRRMLFRSLVSQVRFLCGQLLPLFRSLLARRDTELMTSLILSAGRLGRIAGDLRLFLGRRRDLGGETHRGTAG